MSREEFKQKFDEIFASLLSSGLSRPEAAAQALLKANELCSGMKTNELSTGTLTIVGQMMDSGKESSDYTQVIHLIGKIFSSVDTLISTVLKKQDSNSTSSISESKLDVDSTSFSVSNISIDINSVTYLYSILLSSSIDRVQTALLNALEALTLRIQEHPESFTDDNMLYMTIIVLEHPELFDPKYDILLRYLYHGIDKASTNYKSNFKQWCSSVGIDRYKRYLSIIRHHITLRIYQGAVDDARVTVRVLSLLHSIRSTYPDVNISEFYIDALNQDYMSTRDGRGLEFKLWLDDIRQSYRKAIESNNSSDSIINNQSFISFPFVLCPATKATILEMDAQLQMRLEMDHELRQAWSSGAQYAIPYLILRVRRDFIIPDTLSQMLGFEDQDFKKPLKVIFDGEEGVDAGGVRKEYYQVTRNAMQTPMLEIYFQSRNVRPVMSKVMMKQMLDPSFGMFRYYEESRHIWFSSDSLEASMEFELVGLLLGIAIYNSIIIDLPMPLAVYKKLKGVKCGLDDLRQLEPSLAQGLQTLLDFPGDVLTEFQTPFQVTYEVYGEMRTVNLRTFSDADVEADVDVEMDVAGECTDVTAAAPSPSPSSSNVGAEAAREGDDGGGEGDVDGSAGIATATGSEGMHSGGDAVVADVHSGMSGSEDASANGTASASSGNSVIEVSAAAAAAASAQTNAPEETHSRSGYCHGKVEMVTNANRQEYVDAYVAWILDVSIAQQFEAFARGFHKVCGGIAFNLFEPVELELLVCGSPELDFGDLQYGTKYDDGYSADSRVVKDFWVVLLSFDELEKRLFLKFVSGSDRAPIDGLAHMGFIISKNGADDSRLPSAHTCFNHLLLPEYSSLEVLERKLKLAINQSEGFGLR